MPFPQPRAAFTLAALASAALLFACAGKAPSMLQGNYPNGQPRYRVEVDSLGRKHGLETWWHETGKPRYRARYTRGIRDGAYEAWYTDGRPWYRGTDSLGVAQDSLLLWQPNGQRAAIRIFRQGVLVYSEQIDSTGLTGEEKRLRAAGKLERDRDSLKQVQLEAARAKQNSLAGWAGRVRTTVETYWSPPKARRDVAHKAVAMIEVRADGRIQGVDWIQQSSSREFNDKAARALKRLKKLPPLPPEAAPGPIRVRYEFTTQAPMAAARKLVLRKPEKLSDEVREDSTASKPE